MIIERIKIKYSTNTCFKNGVVENNIVKEEMLNNKYEVPRVDHWLNHP